MRKAALALLAAGALSLSAIIPPAVADPPPQACRGGVVSFAVQLFGGRRAVADTLFGDYPKAVQDAQGFLQTICPN